MNNGGGQISYWHDNISQLHPFTGPQFTIPTPSL